ncbi:uncharacterized protein LOC126819871 [Patella vulgata]|uniref:uncharacterized protein LOC126819871 n=1 Tax=Patella vulgata TaxID=6465 RepID=UPI002180762E|nr:uncharacterized protein LOC126819871 [Patella vulgata]
METWYLNMKLVQKYIALASITVVIIYFYRTTDISLFAKYDKFDKHDHRNYRDELLPAKKPNITAKTKTHNSCIVDDWIRFDPSAETLKRYIFCDEFAKQSDILCRWYLDQQNITDHKTCLLPQDGYKVPNIVFYVHFIYKELDMEVYMCILSAKKIQKPLVIYIIGDRPPLGKWWTKLLEDVPELKFISRAMPRTISGSSVHWLAHASDLVRLQILLANGGIYMDTDEIFINSFEPLRNYTITMGIVDKITGMGNAVIVAQRHSTFLQTIHENYKSFNGSLYYHNSLKAAYKLWLKDKSALNLESDNFYKPGWYQDDKLYKEMGFEWKDQYAIHLWGTRNRYRMPTSMEQIDNWYTTLGQIFRYMYYDDARLRLVVQRENELDDDADVK